MALSLSGLQAIAARGANKFIQDTVNQEAPFFAHLKKNQSKKIRGVEMVNVEPGGLVGGSLADGGTVPATTSSTITQLAVLRQPFAAQVTIPRAAADQVDGAADAVDIVKHYFSLASENLARNVERQLLDGSTGGTITSSGLISASAIDVDFPDISAFRVGNRYVWDDGSSGTGDSELFTVTAISDSGDGSGTVSFSTGASGTVDSADTFYVEDALGNGLVSLSDLSGTGNVYTQSASIGGWEGVSIDQGGAFTTKGLNKLVSRLRQNGGRPSMVVMSPLMFEQWEDATVSAGRRYMEADADPYGDFHSSPKFGGAKVLVTPNCPHLKIFAIPDKSRYMLGIFNDLEPLYSKAAEQHHTDYSYKIAVHGQFNSVCRDRKCVGALTGLTIS